MKGQEHDDMSQPGRRFDLVAQVGGLYLGWQPLLTEGYILKSSLALYACSLSG